MTIDLSELESRCENECKMNILWCMREREGEREKRRRERERERERESQCNLFRNVHNCTLAFVFLVFISRMQVMITAQILAVRNIS